MVFVSFRDRPVLEHIVEQHAEEAAFLWTLRDAATDAPHYKRHHLARLDERVEAHVDGLRVAGEAGWRIALEQLERRCEKGELFAAGVLALESGDMQRIEPLVARAAAAEPATRRGFVGAIAWCRVTLLAQTVRNWNQSAAGFDRYLALCACSVHRADPGPEFRRHLEDQENLVRSRALRLAGELGRKQFLKDCLDHLEDDSDAGFWASWSGVLLGDRRAALEVLSTMAPAHVPEYWTALEVSLRAMGLQRAADFISTMGDTSYVRRIWAVASGHVGDPTAVPGLIEQMDDIETARIAGESFAMICGADIVRDGLEREAVTDDIMSEVTGAAANKAMTLDPDENLASPDPHLVERWWAAHRHRFPFGIRHLLGHPIDEYACERGLNDGYQRQRRAAAYELKLSHAAAPLANVNKLTQSWTRIFRRS